MPGLLVDSVIAVTAEASSIGDQSKRGALTLRTARHRLRQKQGVSGGTTKEDIPGRIG